MLDQNHPQVFLTEQGHTVHRSEVNTIRRNSSKTIKVEYKKTKFD